MKKILVLLFLFPSVAWAEESCGPQDYGSSTQPNFQCPGPGESDLVPDLNPPPSVPVKQGQSIVAPWEGSLVHRDRMTYLGLRISAIRRLRWLDGLEAQQQQEIEVEYVRQTITARLDLATAQRDALQAQLDRANTEIQSAARWWRSPAFWFAVGIVTAGVVTGLLVWGFASLAAATG
jgi:hypothetical protein